MVSHWCSADTWSFNWTTVTLDYHQAMLVISSTWFGPQVSYQVLKSLAFRLWSEFWRHWNDFTVSDYYSPAIVIKHHQYRRTKKKKKRYPENHWVQLHSYSLQSHSKIKPFLFYWSCQQNRIVIPALHPLDWITKYICICQVHFRAHKNIQATKARVISVDVYGVSLLSEMQAPRGDAAESL